MTLATATVDTGARMNRQTGWLTRAESWLDSKGRGAWIAATILGFVLFWPLGLALLVYSIWSKQMFTKSCATRRAPAFAMRRSGFAAMKSSGNTAFDAYKTETLRRLEEEQESFEAFLQRLRDARDKAEFDQFMSDRDRRRNEDTAGDHTPGETGANRDATEQPRA